MTEEEQLVLDIILEVCDPSPFIETIVEQYMEALMTGVSPLRAAIAAAGEMHATRIEALYFKELARIQGEYDDDSET